MMEFMDTTSIVHQARQREHRVQMGAEVAALAALQEGETSSMRMTPDMKREGATELVVPVEDTETMETKMAEAEVEEAQAEEVLAGEATMVAVAVEVPEVLEPTVDTTMKMMAMVEPVAAVAHLKGTGHLKTPLEAQSSRDRVATPTMTTVVKAPVANAVVVPQAEQT